MRQTPVINSKLMWQPYTFISALLLALIVSLLTPTLPTAATELTATDSITIEQTRRQLLENQRNIIYLRQEKLQLQQELQQAITQLQQHSGKYELQAKVVDLRDSIAVSDVLITNISTRAASERLLLSRLERGKPPTTLDIAMNKALHSNLPELAQNLANNKQARKEAARLRTLLKQQARLGVEQPAEGKVINAAEQQLAEREFMRLLSLFSSGSADDAEDKLILISGAINQLAFSEEKSLSYLGHNQYHMETTVHQGNMTFTVDGRPWQITISPSEDQATYVIIYDAGNRIEPRLVMFNKTLLLQ